MSTFKEFAQLVHARFVALSVHELFVVGENPSAFSDAYLKAFPEGTDPLYKTNTQHDCSCCKNFIRHLGNLVAIVDGRVETVWDVEGAPAPYDTVATAMAAFTRSQSIVRVFRSKERSYGHPETLQQVEDAVKRWNHFHGKLANRHYTAEPDTKRGEHGAGLQVLGRGLDEITSEALQTVEDLIRHNSLYRGDEHLLALAAFKIAHEAYHKLDTGGRSLFVWANALEPFARFRNTVIGTLVLDLSAGMDVEQAVRSFESKVAPTNYKRPTALITPGMVKNAMGTITSLGLEPALERRFAKASDLSVNNVIWVHSAIQGRMKDGIEGVLMDAAVAAPPRTEHADDIGIEDFMAKIVPQATGMSVVLKDGHTGNFMSLTAPQNVDAPQLFKWPNGFAWSYDGNVADTIKEKVKRAGGNVTNAKLRVSLAWSNYDDLDIHVIEPNGNHVFYNNKDGKLDVDMNAGVGRTRQPVENVSWRSLMNGTYRVVVNQFQAREATNVGCTVEVENEGKLLQFHYPKAVKGEVLFFTIDVMNGVITKLVPGDGILGGGVSQEKWGVKTESLVPVSMLLYSPNHWDGHAVGNKHWFFILQGCKNPEPARGIYNEFLNNELNEHRKVFEVLGDHTKCAPSDDQLSGVGFSSTRGDTVKVKVTGPKLNKFYNVAFGGATSTQTPVTDEHQHQSV